MLDLKKILLDLAENIKYLDMYDLTNVPQTLKEASNKIGQLELQVIKLQSELNTFSEKRLLDNDICAFTFITNKKEERRQIKQKLDELGIKYSPKDNTERLRRLLRKVSV